MPEDFLDLGPKGCRGKLASERSSSVEVILGTALLIYIAVIVGIYHIRIIFDYD